MIALLSFVCGGSRPGMLLARSLASRVRVVLCDDMGVAARASRLEALALMFRGVGDRSGPFRLFPVVGLFRE